VERVIEVTLATFAAASRIAFERMADLDMIEEEECRTALFAIEREFLKIQTRLRKLRDGKR